MINIEHSVGVGGDDGVGVDGGTHHQYIYVAACFYSVLTPM